MVWFWLKTATKRDGIDIKLIFLFVFECLLVLILKLKIANHKTTNLMLKLQLTDVKSQFHQAIQYIYLIVRCSYLYYNKLLVILCNRPIRSLQKHCNTCHRLFILCLLILYMQFFILCINVCSHSQTYTLTYYENTNRHSHTYILLVCMHMQTNTRLHNQ